MLCSTSFLIYIIVHSSLKCKQHDVIEDLCDSLDFKFVPSALLASFVIYIIYHYSSLKHKQDDVIEALCDSLDFKFVPPARPRALPKPFHYPHNSLFLSQIMAAQWKTNAAQPKQWLLEYIY